MGGFSVDTHLFRELGELLVGRDSTALVELIKNAYDADATRVAVHGVSLDDPKISTIRIVDDGIGMTPSQFEIGFLRIAARTKEDGSRLSLRFKRRYTGAKGIGRLAAHKLARAVTVESIPFAESSNARTGISAMIDWDEVEKKETLDKLDDRAVQVSELDVLRRAKSGTTITLSRLRRAWSEKELARFFAEIQTFEPPPFLAGPLPKTVVSKPLLFAQPLVRDVRGTDPGFTVELSGDFAGGEAYWAPLAAACRWVIEIDASRNSPVRYIVSPTQRTLEEMPDLERSSFDRPHPNPKQGPFFQARILVRHGVLPLPAAQKEWARSVAGVRVFLEGFRVLPYGEQRNDWLSLDFDYTRRYGDFDSSTGAEREVTADDDESLLTLPNASYFGGVFLTNEGSGNLRTLVNREGFVPDLAFEYLVQLVRSGIDLGTRVRAAATAEQRKKRRDVRFLPQIESTPPTYISSREVVVESLNRATTLLHEARAAAASKRYEEATSNAERAIQTLERVPAVWEDLADEGAMLRVLASVGTQLAAFIHEINGLLEMARTLDAAISKIRESPDLPTKYRSSLARVHASVGDLRRHLERQASYLTDVVTPDARRRRSRLSIADRFDSGIRLVQQIADRRSIVIINKIPRDLKSPPMFPAELTVVFSNLLTNAIKAAGHGGRIRATATSQRDGRVRILMENTGARVALSSAERWFRPFESTTVEADPSLGQGMGLGLTITRGIVEEYGGKINFTRPTGDYSTAVEILLPTS